MLSPAEILATLADHDEGRPAVIFHDDLPGPTHGERIELSRRVLRTWVAKAANALQEGLDVEPGSVVRLDVPVPHWRFVYWAYAVWSVGATLTVDDHEGADVIVTVDPFSARAQEADAIVAVTLPALAREAEHDLPTGVLDEAREIASYGDGFEPWDTPDPDDAAFVCDGERTTYADLVPDPRDGVERVLLHDTRAATVLQESLRTFAGGGSLVLVRAAQPVDPADPRWAAEGVTATL